MDDKTMPPGERGYCVVKSGHEYERGSADGMHEWKTPELAFKWLDSVGGVMARFGAAEAFCSYYVAGPNKERLTENEEED